MQPTFPIFQIWSNTFIYRMMLHLCKGHIAKEAVSWWGMIVTEEYYWCLLWNSLYTIRPYSATCWWLYGLWWSNGQQWNISISDGIVKSGKCIFSSSLNEDTWHAFHRPQADKLQCWQYQDHDKIKRGICGRGNNITLDSEWSLNKPECCIIWSQETNCLGNLQRVMWIS